MRPVVGHKKKKGVLFRRERRKKGKAWPGEKKIVAVTPARWGKIKKGGKSFTGREPIKKKGILMDPGKARAYRREELLIT